MFKKGDVVSLVSKFNIVGFFKISMVVNLKYVLEGIPLAYFREEELVQATEEDYEYQKEVSKRLLPGTIEIASKVLSRMYPKFDLSKTEELLRMFDYNQEALVYSCAIMETLETKPFWIEMYEIQDL